LANLQTWSGMNRLTLRSLLLLPARLHLREPAARGPPVLDPEVGFRFAASSRSRSKLRLLQEIKGARLSQGTGQST